VVSAAIWAGKKSDQEGSFAFILKIRIINPLDLTIAVETSHGKESYLSC
jgi:hypothetical protein